MRNPFGWLGTRGPTQSLRDENAALRAEVAACRRTLETLEQDRAALERQVAERTEQLWVTAKRFENALTNSTVTVYEQDEDLRYTWVFNPAGGRTAKEMIGFTEAEIMPGSAEEHRAFKREALATGEARRRELCASWWGETYWFDVRVEPIRLSDGRRGLVGAATDITPQKRQQEHLQVVLSELNHRSKNLLTIVQVIAYQTSVGLDMPPAFLSRFGERLQGLAHAHDVLVNQDWIGADLRAVIESQLQHQLHAHPDRIAIVGEPFVLDSKVAHYVAMAFHELGANAWKYGALSGPAGRVEVRWSSEPDEAGTPTLHLQWTETGGPPVRCVTRKGFGRTILEVITAQAANGRTELAFDEAGVRWSLVAPLRTLG